MIAPASLFGPVEVHPDAGVTGMRQALAVFAETGDLAALELAVRLRAVLLRGGAISDQGLGIGESEKPNSKSPIANHPSAIPEIFVKVCAWCPPARTLAVRTLAERHGLTITHGICPVCAAVMTTRDAVKAQNGPAQERRAGDSKQ